MKRITALLLVIITVLSVSSLVSCAKTETELPDVYDSESRNYETEPMNETDSTTEAQTELQTEAQTEPRTEAQTEVQTELQTESETEEVIGIGGSEFNCKHTGKGYWCGDFHYIDNVMVSYFTDDTSGYFEQYIYNSPTKLGSAEGYDGLGEGSWPNLYDFVHEHKIPRDVLETAIFFNYPGYTNTTLTPEVLDLLYEDKAEEFENYYLNIGSINSEPAKEMKRLDAERYLFIKAYTYENRFDNEAKEAIDAVKESVLARFDSEHFGGVRPDYTGIFSIPEIIYLVGLTKRQAENIFRPYDYYTDEDFPHHQYNISQIFDEREKFEKLIADARAMEDPLDMLKATRAINEMIRK